MNEFNPYQQPQAEIVTGPSAGELAVHAPTRRPFGHGMRWIGDAWDLFTRNWLLWPIGAVLLWAIGGVIGLLPVLGPLVQLVIGPLLYAGIYQLARESDYGEPVRFDQLFAGFRTRTGGLLMLGLINLVLMVALGLVTAVVAWLLLGDSFSQVMETYGAINAGSDPAAVAMPPPQALKQLLLVGLVFLLLLVPYMAAVWFATPLVFFDASMSPVQALGISLKACIRNILPMLLYSLVIFLLLLAAGLTFGLGLIIVWPLLLITAYTSFHDIFLAPEQPRF